MLIEKKICYNCSEFDATGHCHKINHRVESEGLCDKFSRTEGLEESIKKMKEFNYKE